MTRAAIKHGESQLRDAILSRDLDVLEEILSDRLVFCGPDGSLHGKDEATAALRSGALTVTSYGPSELTLELQGEAAFVTVRLELTGEAGGRPFSGAYRHTRTWVREDGAWRVLGSHVSVIVPEDRQV